MKDISEIKPRLVQKVRTRPFVNRVWLLELDNTSMFRHLGSKTDAPPPPRISDRAKASTSGHLSHYWKEFDTLDRDGYFSSKN